MKTTLGPQGEIGIPSEFQAADCLGPGDSFEIQRVLPGRYVLSRIASGESSFSIETGADGLPVIRGKGGMITAALVREIEEVTP